MIVAGLTDRPLNSEQPIKHPKEFQPHYQKIKRDDQAQIYQELIKDSAGDFTTSFLRRITDVKDNRLRPKGYDPAYFEKSDSPYIKALAETHGRAEHDPYYTDPSLTGADRIEYLVSLDPATLARVDHVRVTLLNQSIPPGYLQQRFRDASRGPKQKDDIQRLYYLTSHLNTEAPGEDDKPFIGDWKLKLACGLRKLDAPKATLCTDE